MLTRLTCALMFFLPCADLAAQQALTLTIRVEDDDGALLAGATVELPGVAQTVTDRDGTVRFSGLAAGRHVVAVRAFGYQPVDWPVLLRADTTVVVTLATAAIRMDSVLASARTFTLTTEVRGNDTRRGVPDADVMVDDASERTDGTGFVRVERLPVDAELAIEVRAIGYLPAVVPLTASRDTTIRIDLEVDPVGQAMVRQQLIRLDNAVNGVPAPVRVVTRDYLLQHHAPTIEDVLRRRGVRLSDVTCVVVDGRARFTGMTGAGDMAAGLEYLRAIPPDDLERIEIINRGSMIRVYTYSYVRRGLPRVRRVRGVDTDVCR